MVEPISVKISKDDKLTRMLKRINIREYAFSWFSRDRWGPIDAAYNQMFIFMKFYFNKDTFEVLSS